MPQAFGNLKYVKPHINQHTRVTVTDVMHPDFWQANLLSGALYFFFEGMFCKIEYPVIWLDAVKL